MPLGRAACRASIVSIACLSDPIVSLRLGPNQSVMPAKAGIQDHEHRRSTLDPRLRGDDDRYVASGTNAPPLERVAPQAAVDRDDGAGDVARDRRGEEHG